MSNNTSAGAVQAFFAAFSKGDLEGIVNCFADDCVIHAVRNGDRKASTVYGTYKGKAGVKEFVGNLGSTFNTKAFSVDKIIGEGEVAFASGSFSHEVKSSGKLFNSDWALRCLVQKGRISEYRFFEDSEAFAAAKA